MPDRHRNDQSDFVTTAYFPPDIGRPYRVIFEVDDEGGVWPVAAFRIRDREYKKTR